MFWNWKSAALALALVGLATPAFAGVREFNAAVAAGDYKTAASEAAKIWPTLDKKDPDIATIAREFGFASYIAGDYAAARDFGLFLKNEGSSLPAPDNQPATSAMLLAAAEYRLAPKTSRDALAAALTARVASPSVDNISMLAAESLYLGDWSAGDWPDAEKSAHLAVTLLERGGAPFALRSNSAAMIEAAAGFIHDKSARAYERVVAVHDKIIDDIDAATDSKTRANLVLQSFQAKAWAMASLSVLHYLPELGTHISKEPVVNPRPLRNPKLGFFARPAGMQRQCQGKLDVGGFQYPQLAAYSGLGGAVIIRFRFDDSGKVVSHDVLGSVPSELFSDALIKASPRFKFKPSETPGKACSLSGEGVIEEYTFYTK